MDKIIKQIDDEIIKLNTQLQSETMINKLNNVNQYAQKDKNYLITNDAMNTYRNIIKQSAEYTTITTKINILNNIKLDISNFTNITEINNRANKLKVLKNIKVELDAKIRGLNIATVNNADLNKLKSYMNIAIYLMNNIRTLEYIDEYTKLFIYEVKND